MALEDLIRFQFKRVNPFQGLVLDADTWKDLPLVARGVALARATHVGWPGILDSLLQVPLHRRG